MNKKNIILIVIILTLLLVIYYCRPIGVSNLIQPLTSKNLPWEIETTIFFSAHSEKELYVRNKESIEEIISLLEGIKVRGNIIAPQLYKPRFKESYKLVFSGENKNGQYIYILDNKYIQINQKQYKIIGMPDLSSLYDIIILDQAEGTLDKFYYDLIENKYL